MNITLLANRDLAANYALNLLLPQLKRHRVQLFYSRSVGSNTPPLPSLLALQEYEQSLLASGYKVSLDDLSDHSMASYAVLNDQLERPVMELNRINHDSDLMLFRESEPDLVISIRYGVILRPPAISVPKYGVLNLHSGLLPQYQGVMATFWAMLNNAAAIGSSLHYIVDEQIDTGPMVNRILKSINFERSYLWNVLNLYYEGVETILDAVNQIETNGRLDTQLVDEQACYYSFPKQMDLDAFRQKGHNLFNNDEFQILG